MQRLYKWKEWFDAPPGDDGKVRFVLVRGEHYSCSQSSIIQQLRVAATHCGYRVCAVDMDDRISVAAVRREPPTETSVTVETPFVRITNVDVPMV